MTCDFPRARTLLQITRITRHKKRNGKPTAFTRWFVSSRNPNIVGALALLRAALLKIFNHFEPIYGSLVATLENVRTDQAIPLNGIYKRLA